MNRYFVAKLYQAAVLTLTALAITQPALAATPQQGVIETLGKQVLAVVFTIGGVAACIAGGWVGVNLIIGSAVGSAQVTARALTAIIGVAGGLVLVFAAPNMANEVIKAMTSIPKSIPTIPQP